MQKARGHGTRPLPPLVGTRFQVLFHSPSGVLFTFPSRYWSAIGHQGVLSLGGWSPQIRTAFHGCGPTQEHPREATCFRLRDGCPLWCAVPSASASSWLCDSRLGGAAPGKDVLQHPAGNACTLAPAGFGLVPVRSPLLGESRLISFPRGTEMFQFPRLPSRPYVFRPG